MKVEKTLSSYVLVDSNMRIISEVLDFTNTLESKGLSPNTVKSYLDDLKIFYLWLEREGLKFYEVKPSSITSFIEYIDSRKPSGRVAPATLNRYLATLSSFFRHFEAIGGFVEESPLVKVRGYAPHQNRGYLRHVTKNWDKGLQSYFRRKLKKKSDRKRLYSNTVQKYYQAIDRLWGENESLMFRNKLMFRVLYETGFRVSEVLHLRISDYDYPDPTEKTGNIYLIERDNEPEDRQLKTGERTIPVSWKLLQALEDYVLFHRPQKDDIDYIFVSHSKSNLGEPIGTTSVEKMLNDVQVESGIDYFRLTPHSLRHTHASELQDIGVDVNVIRERLGHQSIATTAKYAKPSVKTLAMAHERYLESKRGDLLD
ncbi:tyrosine-type recombinase/integrase [Bacillus paranthracis]|uniref:tyrosine-type recombinase/integrase n=1 Tax=Bacillus paranthracis TaxID=2026186 RepID=UPI002E237E58|nr:tyrosine-type recombinase/integrase [Bacillus paranthracis]